MSKYTHLTEKDRILFSAYLDGEISEKERAHISALLAVSPDAAKQLESLRNVRSVLRLLPEYKVPHNFTLTRLEAQAAKPNWVFNLMRVVSGISAAALAAVLAFDFLMPMRAAPMSAKMAEDMIVEEMPAAEMAEGLAIEEIPSVEMEEDFEAEEAPAADMAPEPKDEDQPRILNWFPAAPSGLGIGGGGGGDGVPVQPQGPVLPDLSLKPGEALPSPTASFEGDQMLETAEAPMAMEAEESTAVEKGDTNSGPILGVRPEGMQGQTVGGEIVIPGARQLPPKPARRIPYRSIEIALLIIMLISALAAIILRKRKQIS